MRCPKCNGALRIKVSLFLDIPWRYYHRLSKKAVRDADVRIEGAGWPHNMFYCTRCNWFMREGAST